MTISKSGLLGRWYTEWERHGGVRPPVMNLCHFVRVCVLWGPLRAIFWPRRNGWLLKVPPIGWVFLSFLLSGVLSEVLGAGIWLVLLGMALGIGLAAAVLSVVLLAVKAADFASYYSEPIRVYRDYRAARTSRICPLVRLED